MKPIDIHKLTHPKKLVIIYSFYVRISHFRSPGVDIGMGNRQIRLLGSFPFKRGVVNVVHPLVHVVHPLLHVVHLGCTSCTSLVHVVPLHDVH